VKCKILKDRIQTNAKKINDNVNVDADENEDENENENENEKGANRLARTFFYL